MDSHYDTLNSTISRMTFGRFTVPVVMLHSPEEKFRARVAKQDNVDALAKSMMDFGTVNEHVEVVMFIGPGKPFPAKAGFKPPQSAEEMLARGGEGYFTICGDHSQLAMNQLHQKFKKNPKWGSMTVTVFVCHRSSEHLAALKSWGILDNIKGEKRVSVSFLDKVVALHSDYLQLSEHVSEPGHKERTAALKEQRRADFGGVSSGQIMQLWSLAARDGRVWDLLLQIISGQVTSPPGSVKGSKRSARKNKVVKSAANFTAIGGIEDDVLEKLLHDVVIGHASLQRLNEQFGLVKARMKLQTAVLQHKDVADSEWAAAVAKYPLSCHEDFIERWAKSLVREGIKSRASVPELFFAELDRRMVSDLAQLDDRGAVQVSININAFLCCVTVLAKFSCVVLCRRCPQKRKRLRVCCTARTFALSATTRSTWRSSKETSAASMVFPFPLNGEHLNTEMQLAININDSHR